MANHHKIRLIRRAQVDDGSGEPSGRKALVARLLRIESVADVLIFEQKRLHTVWNWDRLGHSLILGGEMPLLG